MEGAAPSVEGRGRSNANRGAECATSSAGTWDGIGRRRGRKEATAKQVSGYCEAGAVESSSGPECAHPRELGWRPHEGSVPRLTGPAAPKGRFRHAIRWLRPHLHATPIRGQPSGSSALGRGIKAPWAGVFKRSWRGHAWSLAEARGWTWEDRVTAQRPGGVPDRGSP